MKKIAIGIINTHDQDTFEACKKSLPSVDFVYDIHHTPYNLTGISPEKIHNKYISYGGLRNIILRQSLRDKADYIFLINSNILVNDNTIFNDYIKTAAAFGAWCMMRGNKNEQPITVEDDLTNINISLYKSLNADLIFMLPAHIKHCGFFNESYINIENTSNNLDVHEFYSKLVSKINYLPRGYYPDTEHSLIKTTDLIKFSKRPCLKNNTTNNLTKVYGQFYYNNKFIPDQPSTVTKESALSTLEQIQKIYSIKL